MILREYLAPENSGGRVRTFIEIRCDNCKATYTRQKRFASDTHGCSAKCLSILKGTTVFVNCAHCNSQVEKKKSQLSNSKSGLYYCDRLCKEQAQILEGEKNYRSRALYHYGEYCHRCGFSNISALDVHHKDKNRSNNDLSNLEVLCCNCHAIEHRIGAAAGADPSLARMAAEFDSQ